MKRRSANCWTIRRRCSCSTRSRSRNFGELGASDTLIAKIAGKGRTPKEDAEITHLAIVLDCSASMQEPTSDGQMKMAVSRRVLGDLVERIPGHLGFSFVIYGHDAKSKCSAVEVVHSSEAFSDAAKSQLRARINGIQPAGKTPIALALQTTGAELAKQPGGCGLVLISDGKETCQGDPVAEIEALARRLPLEFGAHVIGFDVDGEGRTQLEAIAQAGNGTYYNAQSARELAAAIEALREKIEAIGPADRALRDRNLVGQNARPGEFFHDAPLVGDGDYKGSLAMMQGDYYRVGVRAGQELAVIAEVDKTPYDARRLGLENIFQTFRLVIYDRDFSVVGQAAKTLDGNPAATQTFGTGWVPAEDGYVYVGIGATDNHRNLTRFSPIPVSGPKPKPSAYTLEIAGAAAEPTGTVVARRDVEPGEQRRTAGTIEAPGMATTDLKIGEAVWYKLRVAEGERVTVSMAVQKPWYEATHLSLSKIAATYTLSLLDRFGSVIESTEVVAADNPPEAQTAAITLNSDRSGDVYVVLSAENTGGKIVSGDPKPGWVALQVQADSAADDLAANAGD